MIKKLFQPGINTKIISETARKTVIFSQNFIEQLTILILR